MIAQQDIRHPWHSETNFRRESGLELVQLSMLHCQVRKEFTKYFWALVSSHSASRFSVQTGSLSRHKQETASFLHNHTAFIPLPSFCFISIHTDRCPTSTLLAFQPTSKLFRGCWAIMLEAGQYTTRSLLMHGW